MSITIPPANNLELASTASSEATELLDPALLYSYSDLLRMMAERHPSTKMAALCRQQLSQYYASREHVRESFSRLAFTSTWMMWVSMNQLLESGEDLEVETRGVTPASESKPSELAQADN